MKQLLWLLCVVALLHISTFLFGQSLRITHYNVENGLPIELTKSVIQDSIGFTWIATDVGIVRFDGHQFVAYPDALPSPYVKAFLHRQNGQLLVASDLGLTQIVSQTDTVQFVPILSGNRAITDSTLWYPKTLYEDARQTLWISEPESIVAYRNGEMKRYGFPLDYKSGSFTRSFSFAEDGFGNFFIISFTGNLFFYNIENDDFEEIELPQYPSEINSFLRAGLGKMWIGCHNGIYEIEVYPSGKLRKFRQVSDLENVSYLVKWQDQVFAGTWNNGVHQITSEPGRPTKGNIAKLPTTNINHLYTDAAGSLWVSADEGIGLVQATYFKEEKVSNALVEPYIESVAVHNSNQIYVADRYNIYRLNRDQIGFHQTTVFSDVNEYFLSLSSHGDQLWVASQNKVLLFEKEVLSQSFDLSDRGRFIFFIHNDAEKNTWICQDNVIGVSRITPHFELKHYGEEKGFESRVTVIRQSPEGTIYAGGVSENAYLYRYDRKSDQFVNLSIPLPFEVKNEFSIQDLAIDSKGNLWLASSVGLLYFTGTRLEKMEFGGGTLGNYAARAVHITVGDHVWVAFANGLYYYQPAENDLILFDEVCGLPTKTVNYRCIAGDDEGRIWAGTSKGVAYAAHHASAFTLSPSPIWLSLKVNNQKTQVANSYQKPPVFKGNAYIEADFVSLAYPGDKILYQHRLLPKDSTWSAPTAKNNLVLPQISHGNHRFEVRAKQIGEYTWSQPTAFTFGIEKMWYLQWWAWLLYAAVLGLLVWAAVVWNTRRLRNQNVWLEGIIQNRTQELEDFAYIVAHDLKAPLRAMGSLVNWIMVDYGSKFDETGKQQLQMLQGRVHRMYKLIDGIWEYSKAGKEREQKRMVDLNKTIKDVIMLLAPPQHFTIFVENKLPTVYYEPTKILQVFENLISNAIKFNDKAEGSASISSKLENGYFVIRVTDNGPGIAAKYYPQIFKIFNTLQSKDRDKYESMGIGLSLVKKIVEANGGTISIESEEGKGATFLFTILAEKA